MAPRAPSYRPDIDGLRALAVVPVVLFHAGVPAFSGGFIGVDVFFVISGFLITSLIVAEMDRGEFSIARFYERRIRRIFPALVIISLFSIIAGLAILAPADLQALGRSLLATVFFVSNIYFWRSTSYFGNEADTQPLLHTWSLSVEEQYYLFFPLLLIAVSRARIGRTKVILWIGAVSFLLAAAAVFYKPSATFYLLPTRAWELMLGALLATTAWPAPRDGLLRRAIALAAVALILAPVFLYSRETLFPGPAALPPTVGTALLIWTGVGQGTQVHRLLASRPIVAVGQASYSFYLWHFPLLSFGAYLYAGELPLRVALPLCVVALGLSFASLIVVERPFRKRRAHPQSLRLVVGVPVLGMALAAASGCAFQAWKGVPARLDPTAARYVQAGQDKYRHHYECMSVDKVIIAPANACVLGDRSSPPSALLWGDSHSMVTATAMERAAKTLARSFYFAAAADCPPGLGFGIAATFELTRTPSYRYCSAYNEQMLAKALADDRIKAVVLSARWTNWRIGEPNNPAEARVDIRLESDRGMARSMAGNEAIFRAGFERLLARLEAGGKSIYVVGPVPEPTFDVPRMLYLRHLRFGTDAPGPTRTSFYRRHAKILRIFSDLKHQHAFTLIRPDLIVCRTSVCPIVAGDGPVYMDHNHLSVAAALRTSPLYAPVFGPAAPAQRVAATR